MLEFTAKLYFLSIHKAFPIKATYLYDIDVKYICYNNLLKILV